LIWNLAEVIAKLKQEYPGITFLEHPVYLSILAHYRDYWLHASARFYLWSIVLPFTVLHVCRYTFGRSQLLARIVYALPRNCGWCMAL